EREIERLECARARIEDLEALYRAARDDACDASARQEDVRGDTEDPLRRRKLRLGFVDCANAAALLRIEVPPAVRVVDEVQDAVRAPDRLCHRLALRPRDAPLVRERALLGELGPARV